jgi:hypothetical protein
MAASTHGSLRNGVPHGKGITNGPDGEACYGGHYEDAIHHVHGVYKNIDVYRYEEKYMN